MLLEDGAAARSLSLRAVSRDGDDLRVEAVATDGERRWRLSGPLLRVEEAAELGAWLAGLPGDLTLDADEWMSLTFASPALSIAGRRVPGGVVELRVSVLGMAVEGGEPRTTDVAAAEAAPTDQPRTTDVVLGLSLPGANVERAAVAFVSEVAALRD